MLNLVQLQERLKDLPMQTVMQYANGSNPQVPPFLALGELNRRKKMQESAMAEQAKQMEGAPTVKEQIEQATGLMALQGARQQSAMQQQAQQSAMMPLPVQMAGGGMVSFAEGGSTQPKGMTIEELYRSALGREADAGGLEYWTSKIGPTAEGNEIAQFLQVAKPELEKTGYTPFGGDKPLSVADLYEEGLGRFADAEGLRHYINKFGGTVEGTEVGEFLNAAKDEIAKKGITPFEKLGAFETVVDKHVAEALEDIVPTGEKNKYRSGQFEISIDSRGLPSTINYLDEKGNSLGTSAFSAPDIIRNADKFGIDLQDLRGLGLQLDALDIGYRPYQLYPGTGSDHGIDFEDLIAGGFGTAYDWTKDPNVGLKGEGALQQLNADKALVDRLGLVKNPATTKEQGISYEALRSLAGKAGTFPYVVYTGATGTASFYRTLAEAQEAQRRLGGTITDLSGRGPAINTDVFNTPGALTGQYAEQIQQQYTDYEREQAAAARAAQMAAQQAAPKTSAFTSLMSGAQQAAPAGIAALQPAAQQMSYTMPSAVFPAAVTPVVTPSVIPTATTDQTADQRTVRPPMSRADRLLKLNLINLDQYQKMKAEEAKATPTPGGMAAGGIAKLPMRPGMFRRGDYAGGGIVAFQQGGAADVINAAMAESAPDEDIDESKLSPLQKYVYRKMKERGARPDVTERRRAFGLPEAAPDTTARTRADLERREKEMAASDTFVDRLLALQPGRFGSGKLGSSMAQYEKNRAAKMDEIRRLRAAAEDQKAAAEIAFKEGRFAEAERDQDAASKYDMDAISKMSELARNEAQIKQAEASAKSTARVPVMEQVYADLKSGDPKRVASAMAFLGQAKTGVISDEDALTAWNRLSFLEKNKLAKMTPPVTNAMEYKAYLARQGAGGGQSQSQSRVVDFSQLPK